MYPLLTSYLLFEVQVDERNVRVIFVLCHKDPHDEDIILTPTIHNIEHNIAKLHHIHVRRTDADCGLCTPVEDE